MTAVGAIANEGHRLMGGCLCGKVRYAYQGRLGGDLGSATVCHCRQCQRAQGYACAAVPAEALGWAVTEGAALIQEYPSSPDKLRAFCRLCGSPLYSRRLSQPRLLRIRLGSLDQVPLELCVTAHIFCEDEPTWSPGPEAARYSELEPTR